MNLFFRVSSYNAQRRFRVDANDQSRVFPSPGRGWQTFETVVWRQVPVQRRYLEVQVTFVDGKVNLCAVGAEYADKTSSG